MEALAYNIHKTLGSIFSTKKKKREKRNKLKSKISINHLLNSQKCALDKKT